MGDGREGLEGWKRGGGGGLNDGNGKRRRRGRGHGGRGTWVKQPRSREKEYLAV